MGNSKRTGIIIPTAENRSRDHYGHFGTVSAAISLIRHPAIGIPMLVKKHSDLDTDTCPHCNQPLEIAAVNPTFFGQSVVLFVCPGCGLVKRETRDKARQQLRRRISVLEALLTQLYRS